MRRAVAGALFAAALVCAGVALRGRLQLGAAHARAPEFVADSAELLFPFGAIAEKQCAQTRADLGVDVRVETSRGKGEPIAPLAEHRFRELGVGRDAPTGGILVLIDAAAGQARIEVSYSLEGLLPDAIVSRIARDQLVPYVSHRAAGMAVMDVIHFLRDVLLDGVASGELKLPGELGAPDHLTQLLVGHSGGAGAQVALAKLPSHTEYKKRVPDELRERYAPSAEPLQSAAALQRTRRELVGDPTLELFTEGSRVLRARYPVAPYEELLRADATEHSGALEVHVDGERAFVSSRTPARDFVPVLLVREGGLWRVDLVETFKSFFFDGDGHYVLVNGASPYAEFAPNVAGRSDATLAPLDLGGEPLEAALDRLEKSMLPQDRFRLAEVLLRNCGVSAEAIPRYAEAARGAPHDESIVLMYAQRASYFYLPQIAAEAVSGLGPRHFTRAAWLYESGGERELARAYYRKALDFDERDDYARNALDRLARAPR